MYQATWGPAMKVSHLVCLNVVVLRINVRDGALLSVGLLLRTWGCGLVGY